MIIDRIKQIIEFYGLSSRAFSLSIGFTYTTLNNYLTGRRTTIDSELIEKTLSTYKSISAEWLMRGTGNMLISENIDSDSNLDRINKLVDTITTLQDAINEKTKTIKVLEEEIRQLKLNR